MREVVRVLIPAGDPDYPEHPERGPHGVRNWYLTTEHPASSYGLPVLVDEVGNPFGPADLPPGTLVRIRSRSLLMAEGARKAGYPVQT